MNTLKRSNRGATTGGARSSAAAAGGGSIAGVFVAMAQAIFSETSRDAVASCIFDFCCVSLSFAKL